MIVLVNQTKQVDLNTDEWQDIFTTSIDDPFIFLFAVFRSVSPGIGINDSPRLMTIREGENGHVLATAIPNGLGASTGTRIMRPQDGAVAHMLTPGASLQFKIDAPLGVPATGEIDYFGYMLVE